MRFLHPSRRAIATGLVALVASGAAAGVIAVAGASSGAAPVSGIPAAALAATGAAGHARPGARSLRPALLRLLLRETVKQTGDSRKTVVQDLRAGQTLNQIAGGKASSVAAAALAQVKARLDRAVAAHRITSAQEQTRLSAAQAAIAQLMGEDLAAKLPGRSHTA